MDGLVFSNSNWALIFLTQTTSGILGNTLLFGLRNFSLLTTKAFRLIDLILIQILLANILVLFSKGIPQTMAAFGLKSFLDEAGCKLVISVYRVARGVTLSATCLLSSFQASKICPSFSGYMERKLSSPESIGFCCFLCWLLSVLINISTAEHVTGPKNNKNGSMENMYRYCSTLIPVGWRFLLIAIIYTLADGICLGLMVWESRSMVLVLHRHRQRVQHIHSHRFAPRMSPAARATRTILMLVGMFVSFYSLASILSFWITQTRSPRPWLMNTSVLLSSGFPTFCPFVFIFSDRRVSESYCFAWSKKTVASRRVTGL